MAHISKCSLKECNADIVWCRTEKGKKMPLDADPSPEGTFFIDENDADGAPLARYFGVYHPDYRKMTAQQLLHQSHWATCVDAASFRKQGSQR